MVKKTLEVFECDVCGKEGERYQITYPDDTVRILDRCSRHARDLEGFRDQPGTWMSPRPTKSSFRKSSPSELRLALARAQGDGKAD